MFLIKYGNITQPIPELVKIVIRIPNHIFVIGLDQLSIEKLDWATSWAYKFTLLQCVLIFQLNVLSKSIVPTEKDLIYSTVTLNVVDVKMQKTNKWLKIYWSLKQGK